MKCRIYVDEVGNANMQNTGKTHSCEIDTINARYLSLTGIVMSLDHVQNVVHPQMGELKQEFFPCHPDDPVIFHRKEMMQATPPFETLKCEIRRKQFTDMLLSCLTQWEYRVFTVCIDKHKFGTGSYPEWYSRTYPTWQYDPYHYCLAVLVEKAVQYLEAKNKTADVMTESRGTKEDHRLKVSFRALMESGTEYLSAKRFQARMTSKELKIKPKACNIAGLQIADIIAHPSKMLMMKECGILGRNFSLLETEIHKILSRKYDQYQGNIYGKKFL